MERCGRTASLAGGGFSPPIATTGQPGEDADRRAPTRPRTTWGGAAGPRGWQAAGFLHRSPRRDSRARTRIVEPRQEPRTTWGGTAGPRRWQAAGCPQRSPRRDSRAGTRLLEPRQEPLTTWGGAGGRFGWPVARCPRAPSGRCGRAGKCASAPPRKDPTQLSATGAGAAGGRGAGRTVWMARRGGLGFSRPMVSGRGTPSPDGGARRTAELDADFPNRSHGAGTERGSPIRPGPAACSANRTPHRPPSAPMCRGTPRASRNARPGSRRRAAPPPGRHIATRWNTPACCP